MPAFLERLFGGTERKQFERSVERASVLQRLGYDVGFSFMPRYHDMPLLHVCDGRFEERRLLGAGFDCASRSAAFTKALSETLERALWDEDMLFWNEHAVRSTQRALGEMAMSLSALAGFSDEQRTAGRKLVYDLDTEFLFSRAIRLSDGEPLYVPAQLISGRYSADMAGAEPLLRVPNSNGLATHETFDEAARRGLLELIERDAFMISFFNMLSVPRIDPTTITDSRIRSLLQEARRTGFLLDLLVLPTDMPVTVICAIMRDVSGVGPALTLGARAHEDPREAILGALTEVFGVYFLARQLGLYKKELPPHPLRTLERIAYWGKREHVERLAWLWSGALIPMPRGRGRFSSRRLARAVEACGCSVAAISMTPPRLAKLGLTSVCVVSAELQPLNLDEEPAYGGGARLASVPRALGYTTRDAPPPYPHPFP